MYNVPCPESPGVQYIGQTGRSLDRPFWEHRRALKNGNLGSSALAEHVFSLNHWVDLSKTMVIDTYRHSQTCCMLESPGTSSTNRPHSTGTGVLFQDSMLYYWSDLTTFWRSIIIVLLLLLIFAFPFRLIDYLLVLLGCILLLSLFYHHHHPFIFFFFCAF